MYAYCASYTSLVLDVVVRLTIAKGQKSAVSVYLFLRSQKSQPIRTQESTKSVDYIFCKLLPSLTSSLHIRLSSVEFTPGPA